MVEQPVVAAPVIAPAVPLELSEIRALATTPVEPKSSSTTALVPIPAPVPVVVDGNRSSDDDTPRKVSDNVEETRAAELTPERKGFFASLFNSNKTETVRGRLSRTPSMTSMASSTRSRASSVVRVFSPESQSTPTSATKSKGSDQYLQIGEAGDQEETIRKKDTRRPRPTLPVPVMDQMIQTEISSDYVDQLEKEIAETKKALSAVGSADFTRPLSPSLRSRPSQDSIPRSRSRDGVIRVGAPTVVRPTSSSSMRGAAAQHPPLPFNHQEQIAAATHHQPTSAPAYQSLLLETPSKSVMGPPPVPVFRSTTTPSNATRPRTPLTHETTSTATTAINRGRPETPSRAGATPRARFSSVRSSDLSSPASRRSSLSSFASELDGRFNMDNPAIFNGHPNPSGTGTDPKVIQAITQTMIGEYLWKYTRQKGRKDLSSSRHRRFFWVHPYTRTLYWSDRDPQTAGRAELRAKSVSIEAVKVVTDDNPMPPGLHRRSIIVITPGRIIKFTAPTGARHEMWFSALSYLLLRTGEHPGDDVNGAIDEEELSDCGASPASNGGGVYNGRNSMRGASGSFASYSTPSRNTSSLSNRRPGESSTRLQGSMSRLSNIFRPASGFGNYGSRTASGQYNYGTSDFGESNDEDDFGHDHHHDHGEGIENVRACCDGELYPMHPSIPAYYVIIILIHTT